MNSGQFDHICPVCQRLHPEREIFTASALLAEPCAYCGKQTCEYGPRRTLPKHTLTPAERAAVLKLAAAWNAFMALEPRHPDDIPEFRHALHACQNIILARAGMRDAGLKDEPIP